MSYWYAVRPSDTFLLRDGRDFVSGDGAKYESTFPNPSTLGGALGAAIGGRFEFLRGPYLSVYVDDKQWEPFFPMPRNVIAFSLDGNDRTRLVPKPHPPGVVTNDFVGKYLTTPMDGDDEPREYVASLISADSLKEFLEDDQYVPKPSDDEKLESLVPVEHRIGIARAERQTIDGYLYQAHHRRPQDQVAFLVEIDKEPAHVLERMVPFAGVGRMAAVEDADPVKLPQVLVAYPDGRLLLYVATPAIWREGSLPPLPEGVSVTAANIGAPQQIAIGGSRQAGVSATALYWAVPPGSVYFLQFESPEAALTWAEEHHGRALVAGDTDKEQDMASTGFGVIFTGKWSLGES